MLKNKIVVFFVFTFAFTQAQDSLFVRKMTFSELNIGLEYRKSQITTNKTENGAFGGIFASIQHSFFHTIFKHKQKGRFLFGDLIFGQLSTGYVDNTKPSKFQGLWATYNFSLGVGIIYRLHKNHDFGLNLRLLRFEKEITTSFFSGSSIMLRYRFKSFQTELELASPSALWVGWAQNFGNYNQAKQLGLTFKYIFKPNFNVGLQTEILPILSNRITDNGNEKIWHVRLFLGSYF